MLNFKILGHPLNILTVVLIIALFWFAVFALHKTGVLPPHADGTAADSK